MKLVTATSVSIVALLVLAGCGGGGGGQEDVPGTVVIDGWWEYLVRDPGPGGDFEQQFIVPLRQTGTQVEFYDTIFVREGMTLRGAYPDFETAAREEYHLNVRSATLIEGQCISYLAGPEPTYRDLLLRRVPTPDGELTAYGIAWNGPLNLNTSTAYAVKTALGAPSAGSRFVIIDLAGEGRSELRFDLPQYSGSNIFDLARFNGQFIHHNVTDSAVDGTLTLLGSDPSRIQGTYTMTVGPGRGISGQFDVPILMER